MRAATVCFTGYLLLTNPSCGATLAPANSDDLRFEAAGDRSLEQWHGRQHYLYDEDHQPGTETVGSGGSNPPTCNDERVRLRRSDGKTVIQRLKHC